MWNASASAVPAPPGAHAAEPHPGLSMAPVHGGAPRPVRRPRLDIWNFRRGGEWQEKAAASRRLAPGLVALWLDCALATPWPNAALAEFHTGGLDEQGHVRNSTSCDRKKHFGPGRGAHCERILPQRVFARPVGTIRDR